MWKIQPPETVGKLVEKLWISQTDGKVIKNFFSLLEPKKKFILLQTVNWNSWNTLGAPAFESANFKRTVFKKRRPNWYLCRKTSEQKNRENGFNYNSRQGKKKTSTGKWKFGIKLNLTLVLSVIFSRAYSLFILFSFINYIHTMD